MSVSPSLSPSLGWVKGPPGLLAGTSIPHSQCQLERAREHLLRVGGAGSWGSRSVGSSTARLWQLPCSVLISSWKSCLVFFFMMDSQAPISAGWIKGADIFLFLERCPFIVQKNKNLLRQNPKALLPTLHQIRPYASDEQGSPPRGNGTLEPSPEGYSHFPSRPSS